MTLRQLVDATHVLLDELHGPGYVDELLDSDVLVDEQPVQETREQASARRRAELVAAYGPGVIG